MGDEPREGGGRGGRDPVLRSPTPPRGRRRVVEVVLLIGVLTLAAVAIVYASRPSERLVDQATGHAVTLPADVESLAEAAVERATKWMEGNEPLLGFVVVRARGVPVIPIDPADPTIGTLPGTLSDDVGPLRRAVSDLRERLDAYAIVRQSRSLVRDELLLEVASRAEATGHRLAVEFRMLPKSGRALVVRPWTYVESTPNLLTAGK